MKNPQEWNVGAEKLFIIELGTCSATGKLHGRKHCLEGYIRALEEYPVSVGPKTVTGPKKEKRTVQGFSQPQIADLMTFARAELEKETERERRFSVG